MMAPFRMPVSSMSSGYWALTSSLSVISNSERTSPCRASCWAAMGGRAARARAAMRLWLGELALATGDALVAYQRPIFVKRQR